VVVEVLFDGQGKIYLDTGFDKFTRDHSVEVGCLLHFIYEGEGKENMSFRVFDESSCRRHYHGDDSDEDNDNIDDDKL
jgi:hypothetical protein